MKIHNIFRGGDSSALLGSADNGSSDVSGISQDTADLKTDTAVLEVKQDDLAEQVKELKEENAALRHDMINLVIAITAVPVVTFALPSVVTAWRHRMASSSVATAKHKK
jgi:hypothetical protein